MVVRGPLPARRSAFCFVRVVISVSAATSFPFVMASSFVRVAFVPVRFATALRSSAVAVARLAMASIVSCWSVAVSAWKPDAAGVMCRV